MTDIGSRIRRPVVVLFILINMVYAYQSDFPSILKHHKNRFEEESLHQDEKLTVFSLHLQRTQNESLTWNSRNLIEENDDPNDDDDHINTVTNKCSRLFTQQLEGVPFFFCSRRTVWEDQIRLNSCNLDTLERPKRILVILDHAIRSPEKDHHFSYYYPKPRKCWECTHHHHEQKQEKQGETLFNISATTSSLNLDYYARKPNYICNRTTSDHYEEKLKPDFFGSEIIVGKLCLNLPQAQSKYWEKDVMCDRIQILIPNNDSSPSTYFPDFPTYNPDPEWKEKIALIKPHYPSGHFYIDVDPETTDSDEQIIKNHLELIYNRLVSNNNISSSSLCSPSWIFLTCIIVFFVLYDETFGFGLVSIS